MTEPSIAVLDEALQLVQQDKTLVALMKAEVDGLDQALAQTWGVTFYQGVSSVWDLLEKDQDDAAVRRMRHAYDDVASGRKHEDVEFYNALAHPKVFGSLTSLRRTLILDVTALAVGLYRHLGLSGDILDVGCHTGMIASLLAGSLSCNVVGIDRSNEAIEQGLIHSARHKSVSLQQASIPWMTERRFAMVVAASVMSWSPANILPFLKSISELLHPGGVAVVMSTGWADAEPERLRRQLRAAGFGYGYSDVAGGYGNIPAKFEAEGVVVLLKGGTREYPRKIKSLMESDWPRFRDYANAADTLPRMKTQAFERAARRGTASPTKS